ncbi:MFS general substrate transporter [Artomyces pyxidatus]|uniref:MFS general substrate transporter n=1 Tax=Artomyces pyxidatus TaxID=48021 RepID=A0ACB8SMH2_9AGAM|nr:MFS general substrate transporter [Artomyces pyxidatus]
MEATAHEPSSSRPSTGAASLDTRIDAPCSDPADVDPVLKNPHHELPLARRLLIMASIVLTQLIQMIPLGAGIVASLSIAAALGETNPSSATWIAASYPLTQSAFILPGGRLGAIFGHKRLLFIGAVIWVAFSLGSGFAPDFVTLCILRGFTGIGGGLMVPNSVAVLGLTFPPGRLRNLAMGLFGCAAPVGAAGGAIVAGLLAQLTPWKWMFFFLYCTADICCSAISGTFVFATVYLSIPADDPVDRDGSIDFVGAYLGVGGLILFNFVWNQAPAVGWQTPYEYILLIVSLLHFGAFCYWEMRVAKHPILPFTIWTRPSFGPLIVVLFLTFMAFGCLLWYLAVWERTIRHYTNLAIAGSTSPLIIVGGLMALCSAWLIPRIPAQYITGIGLLAVMTSLILLGTMPAQQMYWKQAFVAAIIMGMGPDFVATMGQVIASNSVKRHEQGVAGSLIGVLQTYGLSTGLGFAGTVESQLNDNGRNPVKGFRGAIFLGVGFCVLALIINLLFVRVPKDNQEGWKTDDLRHPTEKVRSEVHMDVKEGHV